MNEDSMDQLKQKQLNAIDYENFVLIEEAQ